MNINFLKSKPLLEEALQVYIPASPSCSIPRSSTEVVLVPFENTEAELESRSSLFLYQEITGRGIPEATQENVTWSEVRTEVFTGPLSKTTSSVHKIN